MRFLTIKATLLALAIASPMCVFSQEIATSDTLALSLDKCIAIALNENPTIKVADMEIERVDYSKKEIICTYTHRRRGHRDRDHPWQRIW